PSTGASPAPTASAGVAPTTPVAPTTVAPAPEAEPPAPSKPGAAPEVAAEPAIALLLRHGSEQIAVPAGKSELLVGRPDPATGAIPELNLGPFDAARTLSRRHARLLLADGRWMLRE